MEYVVKNSPMENIQIKIVSEYGNDIQELLMEDQAMSGIDKRLFFLKETGELEFTVKDNGISGFCNEKGITIDDFCHPRALYKYTLGNRTDIIETILLIRAEHINNINESGDTALFLASSSGNIQIAKLLLEYGARHICNCEEVTPLHIAVKCGHIETVRLLLKFGADQSPCKLGDTPILSAGKAENDDMVEALVENWMHNLSNDHNDRTLYFSAFYGYYQTVRTILKYHKPSYCNSAGASALYWSSYNGHIESTRLLLKHGYTQKCANNGKTPIYMASLNGHLEIVKLLSEYGGKQISCVDGTSPLIAASRNGHMEVAELLLRHGATHEADKLGRTPVYWASIMKHINLTVMLLKNEYGSDEDQITIASELGYDYALKLLVK